MKLEKLELKKTEMAAVKGGTSTTLVTETGVAENEYEDTNGDGKHDKDDKFLGTYDMPL